MGKRRFFVNYASRKPAGRQTIAAMLLKMTNLSSWTCAVSKCVGQFLWRDNLLSVVIVDVVRILSLVPLNCRIADQHNPEPNPELKESQLYAIFPA